MESQPAEPSWPLVLDRLLAGSDLSGAQAAWAMEQMLTGAATPAQVAAFVVALRAKGESTTEVEALVDVMLAHARLLDWGPEGRPVALDVVGTGGDRSHTVNISTMSALVCASLGVLVVKHGNRAASSATGTADVLERLGVVIDLPPEAVVASVRETGIGFCFAQTHHPAMRHVAPTRRELGVPTVFNILGPLTNPGGTPAALVGCADPAMAGVMAAVLHHRGVHALVVRGDDGLDEISTAGPTQVWDATGREVRQVVLDAADLGVPRSDPELLRGGDSARNAQLLRAALGEGPPDGPDASRVRAIRDAVAVNAAAALVAHAAAVDEPGGGDLTDRVAAQLPVARAAVDSGAALAVLDRWAAVTAGLRR